MTCDVALFTVFALHHSLLARSGAKDWCARLVPPELERSLYTWIASLLFIAVCAAWQPVAGTLYIARMARGARLLTPCSSTGLVLTMRSSAALDVLDLAGVRQVQRARDDMPPRHVALETGGLYGFVRHPLYFAWVLMVWRLSRHDRDARQRSRSSRTAYLALAIPWEERSLVETFGADYEAYRREGAVAHAAGLSTDAGTQLSAAAFGSELQLPARIASPVRVPPGSSPRAVRPRLTMTRLRRCLTRRRPRRSHLICRSSRSAAPWCCR